MPDAQRKSKDVFGLGISRNDNEATVAFGEFLQRLHLWLPGTYEEYDKAGSSTSFSSEHGTMGAGA